MRIRNVFLFVTILCLECVKFSLEIATQSSAKLVSDKNAVVSAQEDEDLRSKTSKRGISYNNDRYYGSGPSGYSDYSSNRYGDFGNRYPHTSGGYDRVPSYYEPTGGYNRPSGYGPSYYHDQYDDNRYHEQNSNFDVKGLGLKKLLLPLAGLALLGVAAAASHNPMLLQLGTLNGRRKRSLFPPDVYPMNPVVRPSKE